MTENRTAKVDMSIENDDVVSKINVHGLTHSEFVTGCIATLAEALRRAKLSDYEKDIFKIRLEAVIKMLDCKNDNWISVKYSLPKPNVAVLCTVKYVEPDKWYTYALLIMKGGKWVQFWGDKELEKDYCVTHWQPLPEPPKGE